MQNSPRHNYWGLDRKLGVYLILLPGEQLCEQAQLTHILPRHTSAEKTK